MNFVKHVLIRRKYIVDVFAILDTRITTNRSRKLMMNKGKVQVLKDRKKGKEDS